MWTPAFGIDKRLTWSSWGRVRVKILQTRCYHMIRSTGGDETSSTAIQAAAMQWSLLNESSGLCHRISDNCVGHRNRQIPVQHPHDFGAELRAISFNTSVVPCLGSWKTHFKKLSVSLQSMRPLCTRWHIETKREVDEVARYRQIDK
jgi:hypothetical protein